MGKTVVRSLHTWITWDKYWTQETQKKSEALALAASDATSITSTSTPAVVVTVAAVVPDIVVTFAPQDQRHVLTGWSPRPTHLHQQHNLRPSQPRHIKLREHKHVTTR